jgi:hypothetical protein
VNQGYEKYWSEAYAFTHFLGAGRRWEIPVSTPQPDFWLGFSPQPAGGWGLLMPNDRKDPSNRKAAAPDCEAAPLAFIAEHTAVMLRWVSPDCKSTRIAAAFCALFIGDRALVEKAETYIREYDAVEQKSR